MFTKGSPVSPGSAAFMALQKKEIVRKGGKYGNCTTEWPQGLHLNRAAIAKSPVYNREDCLYFCRLNDLARTCGCIDSYDQFYSTDSSINNASLRFCDNFDPIQRNCRINVEFKSQNGLLDCPCPHPCTSVMFTTQQSLTEWPGETYAPFVVNRLLERSKSTKNLTNENIIQKIRRNFARVEVFYEHITFERIWETPAYDISSLLSDFGGSLGLWLGWSVLIVFQLAHFFCRVALVYARKLMH
ncbi:degenerin-like protein asic-1 [Convolutriloba macropyga]|uniref:degenerin-like protein asic-1 n=1 Tax=Convolutriloba macropyga TaxID=536237 RepID=UPI003F525BBC